MDPSTATSAPSTAPASPIFAAPFSNALALTALPCSASTSSDSNNADSPDLGCPQVHRLQQPGANGAKTAKGSSLDAYLRCRADKCVEQTRRLTAVSSAPTFMAKDLIIAAEALEDCGITACASEFAMAHSLLSVATALTPSSNSSTIPPPPPPPLPTSLGICALSLPIGSTCDQTLANPNSGLPTPPSISRLARTASTSTSPLLASVLGHTLFIPKAPLITGLAASQLAFPLNFYTPAPCPLGRVLSASSLGSVCTRQAECRLGTCPAPTPPGAFLTDPENVPLVLNPPSTPTPPSQSTPPANPAGKTGTLFAIASILAPSILLMVFVVAYMHHRKLERQAYPARQQRVVATRMLAEFPAQRRNREGLPTYSPYPSRPPSYMSVSSASASTVSVVVVAVDPLAELDLADARVLKDNDGEAAGLAGDSMGEGPSSASLPSVDRR
ncbi:hypothetical protein BCR44DRAFT_1435552 [Catenaria anguillulae PL171]|uniref:Uncharacterized protein n=1 Tax=Catenaria anguillulae PL171 TaxID=765915 RepID=A0A1Y2HM05_9FUNG|nr:hypothetical protein BCR44DRAFT_1435552 [Catenaria anguillulae PL171]